MASRVRLLRTGGVAQSCLWGEQQGRVLASTSTTLWLMTDGGQLFWLADAAAPMHRRCGSLGGSVPKVAPETRYGVRTDQLVIAPDHVIELGGPQMWHAPPAGMAAPREVIASGICQLIRSIGTEHGVGFAGLLPGILATLEARVAPPHPENYDAVLLRAEPLVQGLVQAGIARKPDEMAKMAHGLVGLGPGLTPSGDDFLGALLFAIRTLETANAASVKRSCSISTEQYEGRTHLISFTLLNDMAMGHAIAPLHELVKGLITGDSPDRIHGHAMNLIRVGHSTGGDLLTGLLTGLLIGIRAQEG